MEQYVGLDVSLESTSVCVVDASGRVVREAKVPSEPKALIAWFGAHGAPMATVHPGYEWLYLYGFVAPARGAVEWFPCSRVNTALLSTVLARFAAAIGAGRDKAVILVLDRAGWCTSRNLAVPEGVRLVFLPPSSPELQPAERLWPLAREAVANQTFASRADLDQALAVRCLALANQPDLIKAHAHFYWWPEAA